MIDNEVKQYHILKYLNEGHVRKNINLDATALIQQLDYTVPDFKEAFDDLQAKHYIERRDNGCIKISEDGEIKYNEWHRKLEEKGKQQNKKRSWPEKYWWLIGAIAYIGGFISSVLSPIATEWLRPQMLKDTSKQEQPIQEIKDSSTKY